ncbi:uncharacterized protein F4812DRAFT_333416 [Daldinia caldariorum]|uniref:uncharacterized protein n=1 Tax=Daldinia caldariorum TaxID=326644 RepID=UPI00200756C0|nr:uncharacterized protein F4812DRAFT_333416 [Daldinia caldariorum]KAI1469512.1 hypothetical protein F4812DRAFT_333416 [Daldinia caldariorum]
MREKTCTCAHGITRLLPNSKLPILLRGVRPLRRHFLFRELFGLLACRPYFRLDKSRTKFTLFLGLYVGQCENWLRLKSRREFLLSAAFENFYSPAFLERRKLMGKKKKKRAFDINNVMDNKKFTCGEKKNKLANSGAKLLRSLAPVSHYQIRHHEQHRLVNLPICLRTGRIQGLVFRPSPCAYSTLTVFKPSMSGLKPHLALFLETWQLLCRRGGFPVSLGLLKSRRNMDCDLGTPRNRELVAELAELAEFRSKTQKRVPWRDRNFTECVPTRAGFIGGHWNNSELSSQAFTVSCVRILILAAVITSPRYQY